LSSHGGLLGLRSLRRIFEDDARSWDVGGELYYSNSERSGGRKFKRKVRNYHHYLCTELSTDIIVSMGVHYQNTGIGNELSDICLTLNPVMGHMNAFYTTTAFDRQLLMSATYDFNVYSYDSDLAFGCIYMPKKQHQLVKFRLGLQRV
jgi:hypothetical protein